MGGRKCYRGPVGPSPLRNAVGVEGIAPREILIDTNNRSVPNEIQPPAPSDLQLFETNVLANIKALMELEEAFKACEKQGQSEAEGETEEGSNQNDVGGETGDDDQSDKETSDSDESSEAPSLDEEDSHDLSTDSDDSAEMQEGVPLFKYTYWPVDCGLQCAVLTLGLEYDYVTLEPDDSLEIEARNNYICRLWCMVDDGVRMALVGISNIQIPPIYYASKYEVKATTKGCAIIYIPYQGKSGECRRAP